MVSDPIADMLTRIRNGYLAFHQEVKMPFSKMKEALATILVKEGFLKKFSVEDQPQKLLSLSLRYEGKKPALESIKRISKPGRKEYVKAKKITTILLGLETVILSTPEGLMTARQARKKNLGGEVICRVW